MKIGILSDTHGDVRRTEAGLDLLLQHPIEAICHCGDVGSESVLTALSAACLPRKIPGVCGPRQCGSVRRRGDQFPGRPRASACAGGARSWNWAGAPSW
jgi:predicted phosphodiesterase